MTIVVMMGVSGSGKSTVGEALAVRLGWSFLEGDGLHPPANVEKMASGTPLTDADRGPWLAAIADRIDATAAQGRSAVVTCSALKRAYREVLRRPGVRFVHLSGDAATLQARMSARRGHFMPPALLDSQLAALEPPDADEAAMALDIGDPVETLVDRIVAEVERASWDPARPEG